MICNHCTEQSNVYIMFCAGCRRRLAISYDCKWMRKQFVEDTENRWGEVSDWKVGGCGCDRYCKRKANIKIEQSFDAERKEALIRDKRNGVRSVR